MEEESVRIYIRPAYSGYLHISQWEREFAGSGTANTKAKVEIPTNAASLLMSP